MNDIIVETKSLTKGKILKPNLMHIYDFVLR